MAASDSPLVLIAVRPGRGTYLLALELVPRILNVEWVAVSTSEKAGWLQESTSVQADAWKGKNKLRKLLNWR